MRSNWPQLAVIFALTSWGSANAATLYLCSSYAGGKFWSSAHCHKHNALIERMVSVPDAMTFEQQVQLGNQDAAEGARLAAPPARPAVQVYSSSGQSGQNACSALDAEIKHLDDLARRPQSGSTQDWIRAKRQAARDRQFSLRC